VADIAHALTRRRALALTAATTALAATSTNLARAQTAPLAFPSALGWARTTPGGRGGQILRVTTTKLRGPGSLSEALAATGPRIVVFEVGGVIDLGGETLTIREPFLTIAGQTAPSPGVTLIRGGVDIRAHDVVVQHLRVRPGTAGFARRSGRDFDAISTIAAHSVIVDHCSLTWATDENLSASGPRFTGATPQEWRNGTSRRISFTNNLLAEGLADATHAKGEHSKGSLIHDNASDILIANNIYAHNYERNPHLKGGARVAMINNLIYNPGQRAILYNLMGNEWGDRPPVLGALVAVGNVLRGGRDTLPQTPFLQIGGIGDLEAYLSDNIVQDLFGAPLPVTGRFTTSAARIVLRRSPMFWPDGVTALRATQVEAQLLRTAGARPWDRDAHDVRILADIAEGRGRIIDSQEDVGGYPSLATTQRAFDPSAWDMLTMQPLSPSALDASARSGGT
jgi:hypothetical protein